MAEWPNDNRFYKDREEWKDIQPLPQDDGPNPVVKIAYTEKFEDVYGYFRAIMRSGEKSERVLGLTTDAIDCNPANYTVWQYRRETLQAIGADLKKEMVYTAGVIECEPKNYQVWYHRQKLVEWLNDPSDELALTAAVLAEDAKNYHAWQHRQWVVRTFNLWDSELLYVEELLQKDLRNNSAWNHRYFVVSSTTGFTEDVLARELDYTLKYVSRAPNNESSWNYLLGILKDQSISKVAPLRALCDKLLTQHVPSPFLLSTMVDIFEDEVIQGKQESLDSALHYCDRLADEVDPIRKNYWNYVSQRLKSKYSKTKDPGDTVSED